jgi:hypothetical protein
VGSREQTFHKAMTDLYRRTRAETTYNPSIFLTMLSNGGLSAARQLIHSPNVSEGFAKLWELGRLDLTVEATVIQPRWNDLFTDEERQIARSRLKAYEYDFSNDGVDEQPGERQPVHTAEWDLHQIVEHLNGEAKQYRVGFLQQIRQGLKNLKSISSRSIFSSLTTFDDWAFHHGGRSELQFNVGFEVHDGIKELRHGIAFSLEASQTLPDPVGVLLPKIDRFNEFLRLHPGAYSDMEMWYYRGEARSANREPTPIAPELVEPGTFIMLGKRQETASLDFDLILADFDRLLWLYEFVEGDADTFPVTEESGSGLQFVPGHRPGKASTTATRQQRTLDIQLRHNGIQEGVFNHLVAEFGKRAVGTEQRNGPANRVDVVLQTDSGYWFYEIKPGLSARACIRQALAQLLEYAFWPGATPADRLVIVGEARLDTDATAFLETLRERFGIPLYYEQYDSVAKALRS